MNDVKLNLSIVLQGRTMYSQQVAENKPELLKTEKFEFKTSYYNKKTRKKNTKQEIIFYQVRTCIPAKQNINICKGAYEDMVSDSCPKDIKPKDWNRMNKTARLEYHLDLICKNFNGISYTYKIFED